MLNLTYTLSDNIKISRVQSTRTQLRGTFWEAQTAKNPTKAIG